MQHLQIIELATQLKKCNDNFFLLNITVCSVNTIATAFGLVRLPATKAISVHSDVHSNRRFTGFKFPNEMPAFS